MVNGEGERNKAKGVMLKSNINLDLNNSIIIQETNDSESYTILAAYDVENINISNGTLKGDKHTHDYNDKKSTHEWGFGIELKGAKNIKLYNLKIEETTGDGIFISSFTKTNGRIETSENIDIYNNNIYDCRRQGISITCGKNINIYDNEIHDIDGTKPGATIDLEPANDKQIVENVKIYRNKLYNEDKNACLQVMNYTKNIEIYENEINGILGIYSEQEKIIINNNKISNGTIYFSIHERNINDIKFVNKVEFTNNQVNNCDINILNVKDALIQENQLNNCKIDMCDSNVAIVDNEFSEYDDKNYLFKYILEDNNTEKFNLYLWNNNISENQEEIVESEYLTINRDYESLQEYIKNVFNS